MEVTIREVVIAVVVSLVAGLLVMLLSSVVFKRPEYRNDGFIAFVVVLVLFGLSILL